MYEQEHLDDELARLADSLRHRERMVALLQLARFSLELERCIGHEERTFAFAYERFAPRTPSPLDKIRREHTSLRRLVALVAAAVDSADDRRALELIGKLRSVLMLHVTKEQQLFPDQASSASSS